MSMQRYLAPAKINLCLHVLGRRADGYHDLCMLMQKVSLYDEVWLGLRTDSDVRIACEGVTLEAGAENIAERAARQMLAHARNSAGIAAGVDIHIKKHIPVAAGLGGGSSDAATVMLALNGLLDLGMAQEDLASIGVKLGADVPFFLGNSPAWAEGVGEQLSSPGYELPQCVFALVNPGIALSTARVYRMVQSYTPCPVRDRCITSLEGLVSALHNDLEPPALRLAPEVGRVKQRLLELGAYGVLMSGSGATVFGVFDSHADAEKASQYLTRTYGWWSDVVSGVS